MNFLDPKERVIDLQLTSYGRYLLSIGAFKPAIYAFFDDDIIYDQRFTQSGSTTKTEELQNEIELRIQENTPRLEAQTLYRGSELGVFSSNPNLAYNLMPGVLADKKNEVSLTQTPEKSYLLSEPIGNSAYNSKNIAAWDIGFYKAPLLNSSEVLTGSYKEMPTTFIPQLECTIDYHIERYPADVEIQNTLGTWEKMAQAGEDVAAHQAMYDENTPIMFKDDTYMIYKEDFALLKIEEANTEFLKENFEIEVFKKIPVTGSATYIVDGVTRTKTTYSEILKKLYFGGDDVIETDRIDYYFDIDIDFEINEEEYCKLSRDEDKVKNIYVDRVFNCKSRKETLYALNIYATAENQEPEDVCP
jgi:hypothetical protein